MTDVTKLRHAPTGWKMGLTRVVHTDGRHGTFVRNSHPLPEHSPAGWLGVLVRFDGGRDLADVDPADLTVTCLRDPFAAIAASLPTRYAPGATLRPHDYPGPALIWYPVLSYPNSVVESFPAQRVEGFNWVKPSIDACISVRRGDAAPRPRSTDWADDWTVAQFVSDQDTAYNVHVTSQRDALAAWMEAWAIAAALNNNVLYQTGIEVEDIEVLLAAERRALSGPALRDATYLPVGAEPGDEVIVSREQMRGLAGSFPPLLQPVTVADDGNSVYGLADAGARTLTAIRRAGAEEGGPRCRECGCTEDRACPDGCSWLTLTDPAGPLCSACPTTRRR
jgi:hypothetical protein